LQRMSLRFSFFSTGVVRHISLLTSQGVFFSLLLTWASCLRMNVH
jgi:hypothetical protein